MMTFESHCKEVGASSQFFAIGSDSEADGLQQSQGTEEQQRCLDEAIYHLTSGTLSERVETLEQAVARLLRRDSSPANFVRGAADLAQYVAGPPLAFHCACGTPHRLQPLAIAFGMDSAESLAPPSEAGHNEELGRQNAEEEAKEESDTEGIVTGVVALGTEGIVTGVVAQGIVTGVVAQGIVAGVVA